MNDNKKNPQESNNVIAHFGTIKINGPGTYCSGVIKLRANPKKDLLDSAISFLKAADRCLNGGKAEEGIEMLTVPGAVCASFSCELFLKYILLVETGEEVRGHNLVPFPLNKFNFFSYVIPDLIRNPGSKTRIPAFAGMTKCETNFLETALADLFKKCSKEIQSALIERNTSILTILERNNTQFVEARYHHEKEVVSFCQTELLQTAQLLSRYVAERYSKIGN